MKISQRGYIESGEKMELRGGILRVRTERGYAYKAVIKSDEETRTITVKRLWRPIGWLLWHLETVAKTFHEMLK